MLLALIALLGALVLSGCGGGATGGGATGGGAGTTAGGSTGGATTDSGGGSTTDDSSKTARAPLVKDADLVIPLSEVSATARFYPVEIDGTQLEVLAVEAPDGTIRTAFNTCQVCYDSGRGYYKQEGKELVCQNCGNHFKMDEVEVRSGGCNPVPIFAQDKTVSDTAITIPRAYLAEAKDIFANWKTQY
jgi:hypothetical protein